MPEPVGSVKTSRMRKCECACGYVCRVSRRWLAVGLPTCPCGGRLVPEDPDDAALALTPAELEEHPGVVEYRAVLSSVMHGQAWTGRSSARPAPEVARERIEKERRDRAIRNRLAALKRGLEVEPDIPF